jgi:alanine dehydrogenase
MQIGIPREIKPLEGRVALSPEACSSLVHAGHSVTVEQGAGQLCGYTDALYAAAGAAIVPDATALYRNAQLIVKVKEPVGAELELLQRDHLLFCFLHLAAYPELADRLQGGKGLLLGGLPGAERGRVVIVGAGNAGGNAATMAAAIGAEVVVFDLRRERLAAMRALGNNVTGLYPYPDALAREIAAADLLIGAALRTGERAPHIVSRDMVRSMQPGSVIVDISVDQGGCIATTRPTSYAEPTYVEEGMVHFAVTNMPGAVPRSATQALSTALLPCVLQLSQPDWQSSAMLRRGINTAAGALVHPALKESLA